MEVHINWNDESSLKAAIINKLHCEFGTNLEEAAAELIYKACALVRTLNKIGLWAVRQ
jgi:hypothetical protein